MPIFSNRSIVSMMDEVISVLGPERRVDWISRLNATVDYVIAAEWEIAALYCLAKQGGIQVAPRREGVGDLEVIYTSHSTGTRVGIEVTAVSDKSYYETNPTEAFKDEILRITFKHNIHKVGAIQYDIGSVSGDRGPILGLPPARKLARFFHTPEFSRFIADIKKQPVQAHALLFEFNQAKSRVHFVPGTGMGGGTHTVHTLPFDPYKNPITSRLNAKDEQIARAELKLPAVVILCDADCHALHATGNTFRAKSVIDVINIFLNVRRQSRRINGVSVWPVFSDYNLRSGKPPRYFTKPQHIKTVAPTHYPLDDATLAEISASTSHLPRIDSMPVNAKRKTPWPRYFGGLSVQGSNPMRIRMSLLSLQYLLSGNIPADKFAGGNKELMKQFKLATNRGFIISAVRVERSADQDDDWLEIELEQTAPSHAFKQPPAS